MKFAPSVVALALFLPMMASAQEKTDPAPLHTYRLNYTLTDTEAGKKVGVQHISLTISTSLAHGTNYAVAKVGSRIPIATGNYANTEAKTVQTQMTYLDVGVNIRAELHEFGNGILMTNKIEQSSMADAPPATPADPIIRQALIDNDAIVTPGKPVMLGSMDIPGSTRHTEVELVIEKIS